MRDSWLKLSFMLCFPSNIFLPNLSNYFYNADMWLISEQSMKNQKWGNCSYDRHPMGKDKFTIKFLKMSFACSHKLHVSKTDMQDVYWERLLGSAPMEGTGRKQRVKLDYITGPRSAWVDPNRSSGAKSAFQCSPLLNLKLWSLYTQTSWALGLLNKAVALDEAALCRWSNFLRSWQLKLIFQDYVQYLDKKLLLEGCTGQNVLIWAKCPLPTLFCLFRLV